MGLSARPLHLGRPLLLIRRSSTHSNSLELLNPPDLGLTYPEGSEHLNPQHFYQMIRYGSNMSQQKLIASGNHVAEELTIRFAHRIRQMQLLPYRLMGHPALIETYEQYVDSFEMLRRIGEVKTMEDNDKLLETGHKLLEKHTKVVTTALGGIRDILRRPHKVEDVAILDDLAKTLLTSRLSRRVLVKQHTNLTNAWRSGVRKVSNETHVLGEINLKCRIIDSLDTVVERAKANLARGYNVPIEEMPEVVVEGESADIAATFPYILPHFDFSLGELMYNSLEACIRQKIKAPIVVTVSATTDSVLVRISDQAGGLTPEQQENIWSFVGPVLDLDVSQKISAIGLANHQFFSLLFPAEEHDDAEALLPTTMVADTTHIGLGLALSRLYVEYWGGALELHSLDGFGCDALLRVSRTGAKQENLLLR